MPNYNCQFFRTKATSTPIGVPTVYPSVPTSSAEVTILDQPLEVHIAAAVAGPPIAALDAVNNACKST